MNHRATLRELSLLQAKYTVECVRWKVADSKERSVSRLRAQHISSVLASVAITIAECLLSSAIWCSWQGRRYEARLIKVRPLKQLQSTPHINAQKAMTGITVHQAV